LDPKRDARPRGKQQVKSPRAPERVQVKADDHLLAVRLLLEHAVTFDRHLPEPSFLWRDVSSFALEQRDDPTSLKSFHLQPEEFVSRISEGEKRGDGQDGIHGIHTLPPRAGAGDTYV